MPPSYRFSLPQKSHKSAYPLPVFHQDNILTLMEEDLLCKLTSICGLFLLHKSFRFFLQCSSHFSI